MSGKSQSLGPGIPRDTLYCKNDGDGYNGKIGKTFIN